MIFGRIKKLEAMVWALEAHVKNLLSKERRENCSKGIHAGEHQIITSTDRIWVRCSICWGDLSENAHVKK